MRSEQLDEQPYLRLVRSFSADDRPQVVWLTGGEPLLRPRLVSQLAQLSQAVGSRTALLSGMWFAGAPRMPAGIARALRDVDHVSASIDRFHEQEVPRSAVLETLAQLADEGRAVSVHLTGEGEHDPYLADAIAETRSRLADRCPIYVALVAPVGRAADWMDEHEAQAAATSAAPCPLVTWPVVAFDGTIVACCSQLAVDGPAPAHLRLGDAATDGWPSIRERAQHATMLRAIRTFGPRWLAAHEGGSDCDGYCQTCMSLSDEPGVAERIAARMARPQTELIERHAERARPTAGEWIGLPRFAHLIELGRPVPA